MKEKVRQATNIVELVGEYVRLTPKGRNYVGLCPWHDDSKPSLQVDSEYQTYRCWVCNLYGDVFSFVMKMEGVSFPEALQILADRAGIEIPKEPKRGYSSGFANEKMDGHSERSADFPDFSSTAGKKAYFAATAWAEEQYYRHFLSLPEEHPARTYLRERSITTESVEKFRIGFAPSEWEWLQKLAKKERQNVKLLHETGYLGFSEERESYYERFRGRLLFPIHDLQGRSVGIGGRVIPNVACSNESAKYVNTPDTVLFSKHRLLYGLDLARPTIYKKKRAIVMEGYTDTIMAHQHGFTEAVAVLGTALGIDHIRTLKRLADTIYLVLDGDAAGQKRTAEVLELFVAEKVDVRILTLPDNLDPAEFLEKEGAESFENLLATQATDALSHAYNIYTRGLDFDNIHQTENALEKILNLIAGAARFSTDRFGTTSFREEKLLQKLAFSFSVSEDFLKKRLHELREKARSEAFSRQKFQQMQAKQEQFQSETLKTERPASVPRSDSGFVPDESEYLGEDEEFDSGVSDVIQNVEQTALDIGSFVNTDDNPAMYNGESFEEYADSADWAVFGKIEAWEKELIQILLNFPEMVSYILERITPTQLIFVPARELFIRIAELHDDGQEPTFSVVMTSFESEKMKNWVAEQKMSSIWNSETDRTTSQLPEIIDELILNCERFRFNAGKLRHIDAFRATGCDDEQKLDMLEQLIRLKRRASGDGAEE